MSLKENTCFEKLVYGRSMLTHIYPLKPSESILIYNISLQTNKMSTINKKQNVNWAKQMYINLLNVIYRMSFHTISVNVCKSLHTSVNIFS